ncbi:MAG TPA: hypothetical protein VGL90_08445 [Casimicrobiaceae bacterium]
MTKLQQAALEQCAGRPAQSHIAELDGRQREHRGAEEVAQLVCEKPKAFIELVHLLVRNDQVPLITEFRDRHGDGVVEAAVQRAELVDADGGVGFDCEISDGLAKITIVMNDLLDGEPALQEFAAVKGGGFADLGHDRRSSAAGWAGDLAAP